MKIVLSLVVLYMFLLTGCGSIATTAKGWGLSFGNGTFFVRIGSWESTGIIVRENTTCEITSAASVVADTDRMPSTATSLDAMAATRSGTNIGNTAGTTVKMVTGMQTSRHLTNVFTSPTLTASAVELARTVYAADLARAQHVPEITPTGSASIASVGKFTATAKTLQRMGEETIEPITLADPVITISPDSITIEPKKVEEKAPVEVAPVEVAPAQPEIVPPKRKSGIISWILTLGLMGSMFALGYYLYDHIVLLFKRTKPTPTVTGSTEPIAYDINDNNNIPG